MSRDLNNATSTEGLRDNSIKRGILYGVSTGPGDPELMTMKAVKCLEHVSVIAAPRTRGVNSMALDIVKGCVDVSDKEICFLDFAMKKDEDILNTTHDEQARQIEQYLLAGRDVAMLNIGDASMFGTFCYIRDIVRRDGFETITIPGVTSFSACAALLGQSLTTMGEVMTVIPGSFDNVSEELDRTGSKVLMKSGSSLPEVKKLIAEKGLVEKTSMVVNCGLENERVYKDITQSGDDEGYFVTILVEG